MKQQKRASKTIDIVSYALKVSENGVTCVFVVHFRSTFQSCVHQNMCDVTGNNFILPKALGIWIIKTWVKYLGPRS